MKPPKASELARYFDHTILKAEATRAQVDQICDEALEYGFFGVCVNSVFVPHVAKRLAGSAVIPLSVVGFPLGAMSLASKVYETQWACAEGAREIDTVVPLGLYFGGDEKAVREDLEGVCKAADGVPVKVILETCYLAEQQITELTNWSIEAGAAFVKTSTGFGSRGASVDDVKTMKAAILAKGSSTTGIKASGGIRDLAFTSELIKAGATRIGASASVAIVNEL